MPKSVFSALIAAAVAALLLPVIDTTEIVAHTWYLLAELAVMATWWVLWSVRRPPDAAAWRTLMIGWSACVGAEILSYTIHHFGLPLPMNWPARTSAVLGFLLIGSGLYAFCTHRAQREKKRALLDAGVITVGIGTPLFALRVLPESEATAFDRVGLAGRELVCLLSLAIAARFVVDWRERRQPWRLWVAGAALANAAASYLAAGHPATGDTGLAVSRALWVVSAIAAVAGMATVTAHGNSIEVRSGTEVERPASRTIAALVLSLATPGLTLTAADFFALPVSLPAIAAGSVALAILVAARVTMLVGQLHRQSQRLSLDASSDELTGALNRRGWNHALAAACRRAEWSMQTFGLAVIDLDRFKTYNDRFGHQAGDTLLSDVARIWRQLLPPSAVLARYGGEEFAVIVPVDEAEPMLRLLADMRAAMPLAQDFSSGVTMWRPGLGGPALFAEADQALYEAKNAGRGQDAVAEAAREILLVQRPRRPVPAPAGPFTGRRTARKALVSTGPAARTPRPLVGTQRTAEVTTPQLGSD